jgi:hypothetical protein
LESNQQAFGYFVRIHHWHPFNVESLTLDNSQTKEKFVIEEVGEYAEVNISRYPMATSDKWIEEIRTGDYEYRYRSIIMKI